MRVSIELIISSNNYSHNNEQWAWTQIRQPNKKRVPTETSDPNHFPTHRKQCLHRKYRKIRRGSGAIALKDTVVISVDTEMHKHLEVTLMPGSMALSKHLPLRLNKKKS